MYYNGDGTVKDLKQGFYWYKKSAEQGNPIAQSNIATLYSSGNGIEKNSKKI